jgi:hypothetical protein
MRSRVAKGDAVEGCETRAYLHNQAIGLRDANIPSSEEQAKSREECRLFDAAMRFLE